MMTQDDHTRPVCQGGKGGAVSTWNDVVLAYGTEPDAGPDRAFACHVRNMMRRPTLDVELVSHCNLNCVSCFHYSPIAAPGFLQPEDYERDLALLAGIEGLEEYLNAICLVGGEPLLHPQLADLVRLTRRHLPRVTIRLVTNGLLLGDAPAGIWEALRWAGAEVLITPYPVDVDYAGLQERARGQGVRACLGGGLARSGAGEAFFLETPLDETGSQDPTVAFVACPLAGSTLQLVGSRIYPCDRGALFMRLNERFGTSFEHEPDDYLEIRDVRTAREIDAFRRTKKPMCRYCAQRLTRRVAWRPSSRSADEWLTGHGLA